MSLVKYKAKRSTGKTPEPFGGKPDKKELRFVVQKHAASHLHYDFRLEMDGVLKSWAVPKGPSMDPDVKRLAMMVEDHPYDYRTFEGIIPKGEYGGGTVMVWDQGTYEPAEDLQKDKKTNEKNLLKQLNAGKIKFDINGDKLQGQFALVRAHGRGDNGWLLMKLNDKYATKDDITLQDKSVISGQDLKEIAATSDNIYRQKKEGKSVSKKTVKKSLDKQLDPENTHVPEPQLDVTEIIKKAPKGRFDTKITPMLATLADAPFDDPGWQYEVKWDGYRALAFMKGEQVELKSRNNKSFNDKFYPVYDAIKAWNLNTIIDGEIVVVNEKGISTFGALQNWRSEADGEILFYVFDILWLDGKNLTGLTQKERSAALLPLIPEGGIIRSGFSVEARGTDFFDAAKEMGLEGIIAKKLDSTYLPGERSRDWLKIKVQKRQEVVIAGYTRNEDTPKLFSSLLLGAYEGKNLKYVGKVGTGFNQKQQKEMIALFKPLITERTPFEEIPDYNKPSRFRRNPPHATVTWLKPELVCEVNFSEITQDGVFRHPSFVAMREDKNAKEVVVETATDSGKVTKSRKAGLEEIVRTPEKQEGRTLLNPKEKTQCKKLQGHELKFTNLNKIYWPDEKIAKRDLINYYYQVAPFILPYLKDRPESLNRFPGGIKGPSFYQKDVTRKVPEWMTRYRYQSSDDPEDKNYLVANDEATLLYMANLGAIEINPWSSTTDNPDHPTWCIIDLDPAPKTTFEQVIEAAQVTKSVLDQLGAASYPKTSGSTGIHIYIPLGGKYTYEQSKEFARVIVTLVNEQIPDFTSLERAVKARKGKMYLDFLQNRPGATLAAPYSVRPKPGATVSMPLHWEEVKPGLKMSDFTIFNTMQRIKEVGDLFLPVLGKGIDLHKIVGADE
ncbi:DNA ligase D [Dyadobacter sp. CY312]|uniref:DNA ligase D n=1 Tax=Dyadobacter sp. CY312 TaxID=2907303 RepID=UPI001F3453C6|nr:DNA ligase D [Dyadobacter sp. CY312]MCE7042382.1 DNA ligase D [Dyadobacter sp. CY312]